MKDIVILIPNQKCLLKIRALAPVEIHQSLTNLKILKDEKEERERIKKKEQEWFLWKTQQQHNDGKMGGRSASGLEELIMGCTSSTTHHDVKEDGTDHGYYNFSDILSVTCLNFKYGSSSVVTRSRMVEVLNILASP
ncbi:hypothetical protein YC2023_043601 [Brassica napus]